MKSIVNTKSRFRILKGGKISLVLTAMLGSATLSIASPTGGIVTSGNANISQSGNATNINQNSSKATINWQSFSIASNETVNFNQPDVNSITLNRVIGTEKSVINGALNANGQVWLLNSNGVLFGKNASINTAGILATTAELSDTDFNAGNYNFKNSSSNSIINEGTIEVSNNGSVILASNEVVNSGTIKAVKGKVHLVGASDYSINLNGNSLVNLKVDKGVLDAQVENSGTILADGGEIYLTTNAVDELLKGVVNNTGLIEANSLDGLTGKVELFAHGGTAQIGGTITALDGFVETSGKYYDFLGADIQAGEWLIDPVNITIDATLAGAVESALGIGDVTISTAGGNTPDTSSGESGTDGDINVNSAINWSANKLTLHADNDINFNASLTASATALLAFEYGQGTADGGSSTYTVADGVDIIIPTATAFTWKKGNTGTATNLVFDNGNLKFGDGEEASINSMASLLQPFYYDNVTTGRDDWYKLTYSDYPLDFMIGINGSGYNGGSLYDTAGEENDLSSAVSNLSINISKYFEKTGTISVDMDVTTDAGTLPVSQEYTLLEDSTYVKAVTTLSNTTGSDIANARLWIGTQDDYVADSDSNYKTRGNIDSSGFVAVADQTADSAKALIVSENALDSGEGAAVLFYSTTPGTNAIVADDYEWSNIIDADPTNLDDISQSDEDGSYALYLDLGNFPNGAQGSVTWYYAAAPVSELEATINNVGQSAGITPTPTPAPIPTTGNEDVDQVITAIVNNNLLNVNIPNIGFNEGSSGLLGSIPMENEPTKLLTLSEIKAMQTPSAEGTKESSPGIPVVKELRVALSRNSIVSLVNGGVNLPSGLEQYFFFVENEEN